MTDPLSRAAAARSRAAAAAEAAARARARVQRTPSPETVAEAEERRLHAQERLGAVRIELRDALERSRRAHLAAAELEDRAGNHASADRHRAEAEEDRRKQEELEG